MAENKLVTSNIFTGCSKERIVEIYRAVGLKEYFVIMESEKFSCYSFGAEVKYFGLDFDETLTFANQLINIEVVAIIAVKIWEEDLHRVGDFTHVDSQIFKQGTVEIPLENLDEFNEAIWGMVHKL